MSSRSIDYQAMSDADLARAIAARDLLAVRIVTTRHNQRLFRTIWSVLRHRADVEDALQETYLRAFANIGSFEGRSSLSTWLTRIAIHCALERKRQEARLRHHLEEAQIASLAAFRERALSLDSFAQSPEGSLARSQLGEVLKLAIAELPEDYRLVLVLRELEGLSIEEVAAAMDIPAATVKTRAFRARKLLRGRLEAEFGSALAEALQFAGASCARITERVATAFAQS